MSEAKQRAEVIAEARQWIGTPYHHGADIRGAGVDCGMFLIRVFADLGLMESFDPRPYPPDWHLHRDGEKYLGWIERHCGPIEAAAPGDIVLFRYGRAFAHGAIVTAANPMTIIHAYADSGMVLEEPIARDPRLSDPRRERRFFSFWQNRG